MTGNVNGQHRRPAVARLLGVLAGCALLAACSSTPSATPLPPTPVPLDHFDEGGIAFDYPAAWRVFRHQELTTMSNTIAYLATIDVPPPCATLGPDGSGGMECRPRYRVVPDSVVVRIDSGGNPVFSILNRPAAATPLVVDGLPGWFEVAASDEDQPTPNRVLSWTLAQPGNPWSSYGVTATIGEPDLSGYEAAVRALVASLRHDPPVPMLTAGPGADVEAGNHALAVLRAGEPGSWDCFPSPGQSRAAEVTAVPMSGVLDSPRLATCSTRIEPTPMQMWRMALTLVFEDAGPQQRRGETITVWVQPDGTPGATEGGSIQP